MKNLDLSLIKYDPDTGLFQRWHRQWNRWQPISPTPTDRGYLRAKIDGKHIMLHALAYFMMTGNDPIEIDHINRNPSNNRWSNLRNCTRNTNCSNRAKSTMGVVYLGEKKQVKKWRASIRAFGINTTIGSFMTQEEAQSYYLKALSFVESGDLTGFIEWKKSIFLANKKSSKVNYSNASKRVWEIRNATN